MASMTERYDRAAARYERWWAPVLRPTALRLLDEAASHLPPDLPARILDIGSGMGVLAVAAVRRWQGATVWGIDGSAGMLEVAEAEARRHLPAGERARLEFRVAGADALPFEDGTFDLAVSSFVFQLVPDRLAALREAHRVLRPGGALAYTTWLHRSIPFEPDAAFDRAVEAVGIDEKADEGDARSGDLASPAAAEAQLRRAGFRAVRARAGELEHRWKRSEYLDFVEHYDEVDLFASLDRATRRRLRAVAAGELAKLPSEAFTWRAPVVTAVGRRP